MGMFFGIAKIKRCAKIRGSLVFLLFLNAEGLPYSNLTSLIFARPKYAKIKGARQGCADNRGARIGFLGARKLKGARKLEGVLFFADF